MPESESKEHAFDEQVLTASLRHHDEGLQHEFLHLHGIRDILSILNAAIDVPEYWPSELPKHHATGGFNKWLRFRLYDFPYTSEQINDKLVLPSLYPEVEKYCASAPVRMLCRLTHLSTNTGYIIGIIWPSLDVELHIGEGIWIEDGSSTETSRFFEWRRNFPGGNIRIVMTEQEEEYPEEYCLNIQVKGGEIDPQEVVRFIEMVMRIPQSSMPEWKVSLVGLSKSVLKPYRHRLWQYGIEL